MVAEELIMANHRKGVKVVSEMKDWVSLSFHSANGRFGKSSG